MWEDMHGEQHQGLCVPGLNAAFVGWGGTTEDLEVWNRVLGRSRGCSERTSCK